MNELTPMQELIEIIKEKRKESDISNTMLRFCQVEAEKLLPKEKQVIESCCIDMVNLSITKMENKDFEKGMEEEFNDYYNNKFKKD